MRASARGSILRSLLLFTPFFIVAAVAFAFLLRETFDEGSSAGRVVGLTLVGFVGLLLLYQVVQSLRDLASRPVETVGRVDRRWSRSDFFIFRNDYIFVDRNVFRLEPEQAIEVDLGDTVRVTHFPHTSTVEQIEVVTRAGSAARTAHA